MVIDLLEREKVNIKDLVLPEPKPVIVRGFDPTELIKDKDYTFLVKRMQELKEQNVFQVGWLHKASPEENENTDKWSGLMLELSSLKFACPEKFEQLDSQNNLNRFYMTQVLNILKKDRNYNISQYASYLTLLYPDNQRIKRTVSEFIPLIFQEFERLKNTGLFVTENYRMLRAGAIVLATHSQPLGLDDTFYSMLLTHYHDSAETHRAMDRPLGIAEDAATMRILFPDKPVSDYLTSGDFKSIEERFKDVLARPEWYGKEAFIHPAFDLKILSAESITLGENGLEIKMPQTAPSIAEPKPSLPVGRKF